MSVTRWARALALALALGVTACQDYNFNPVGHCLIQPGSQRFTLSNISSADVLFVVDDSGSMAGEQKALADNFQTFIANLDGTNVQRKAAGLEPIDFHIAVTTSSIYWNPEQAGQTCSATCGGAAGRAVCCQGSTPARRPRACTPGGSECAAAPALSGGTSCRLDCSGLKGSWTCCHADGSIPATDVIGKGDLVACTNVGQPCGGLQTHYALDGACSPAAANETPYPDGDFVSSARFSSYDAWTSYATTPLPRVLHFDKELYGATGKNRQGDTSAQLVAWFKQNVMVGTCGSGQEQLLQAGRRAISKAYAGLQKDTRGTSGAWAWTPPSGTALAGGATARWPNPNSKLVVVFVGDEDDCSSPADPSGGVVMLANEGPGQDACTRDASDAAPLGRRQYAVDDFVSFFSAANLGRPVGAGFILPATEASCTLQTCTASGLCCPPTGCAPNAGAQAKGARLLAAAQGLAANGVDVVAGSICDPDFGTILNGIAEIVKPPETLSLPTEPAEGRITLLRILPEEESAPARICGRPLAPRSPNYTLAEAKATGADWWFTDKATPGPPALDPTGVSSAGVAFPTKTVYINPSGACIANPGETYSADYLGVVPPGGCASSADCQSKLGGPAGSFECFVPPGLTRGTCTCKSAL